MDRLKEMAQDTEATAQVFLQARGGEPLDCPRCGSSAQTRRAPGKEQRPDIFRCTPCKAAFGIRTGTAMHSSRETLGTWLTAIRLVADTGGEASGRDLSNLTRTGSKAAADMIAAIRSKMGSPGGLLAAVVRVEGRAKPPERTDAGRETPDPETPDPETPNPETPSGETPSPETPSPETPSRETPSPETPSREMTSPETPSGETTSREMTSGETESGAAARAALPSGPITELSLDGMKELAGDDIACAGLFMAARDQGGIDCPRCGLREETKRMGAARPAQFRCQICNSIYSVRTGTPIRGLAVSLGKWAMAGYLVATGATPEDEGELTRLIGTTRSMARKIMDTAVQTCPVGQDPIPELVRVTARRPRDAGAEAEADADTDADTDTDTTQQEPRGKTQASQATRADQTAQGEREAREDGRHAGAENGSAGGAGQTEIGQPAPGADILSPDG